MTPATPLLPPHAGLSPRGIGSSWRIEQILAAAVRVFGAGGHGAVTHRAVAAEAGVSVGLTTYYFKNRENLLFSAVKYAISIESARLHALVDDLPAQLPADRSVAVLTEMFFDKTVADPLYDLALFEMFLEATRNPAARELTRAWTELILGLVERVLPPTDPSLPRAQAVQIVAATIDGLMLEEAANQTLGLAALRTHLQAVVDRLLPHP
ncbi:TetR/AcrR family transcriptional regulator [Buchananella hordeovulneris]|uniref:HTH tetR-type domain-containing protein n=1 Tax=Buchananella hordeovulneris TaxID=52770 RepID=A0A1Q5PZ07_9ACTO|nr:TetR family transcriptional regulator [Buchananella hordeovulneris]MDO5081152.1 TetR family transcriptional regulator [Buchananella hordeovulneris]OKL52692.1 hypothetical protein BSZ40_00865 [Buchananella hordeovulneris]RRD43792.1 TetR family transcriptional regulator [Buchananella hordeovulneris]RRD50672.1 TetR family transcriptional regulator [Buchananella hordeovulneris]